MHPAPSLIFFSVLSGLGFGLLAMLGLGVGPARGDNAAIFHLIGLALAGAGLVSSAFHLGHPERALKAFTQWRSSWLSREAWLSSVAMTIFGLQVVLILFGPGRIAVLGWAGAVFALATVAATSMIYAQLRTVPRWYHWSVPALFVGYALAGGALLAGQVTAAALMLSALGLAQFAAWRRGDRRFRASSSSVTSATGLGVPGRIRLFEPPHTGGNYLTREMVFVVARKHITKLRSLALVAAFIAPVLFLILPFSHVLAALAVLSHLLGALMTRWLFFAEAEHVVGLYYGRDTAS